MPSCVVANIDLTVYEGGTFDQEFIWEAGSPAVAVDLTGFDAVLTARLNISDEDALLSLSLGVDPWVEDADSGIYITSPLLGKYKIYINDLDTKNICGADHLQISAPYDLFMTDTNGEVVFKQYGNIIGIPAVTRWQTS